MAQRYAFRKMVEGARKENGRYVIPMVMNDKIKIFSKKENVDAILRHAENFLKSSDKKQKKNQGYHDEVVKYFSYMEEADILEDIPEDELKSTDCYYLAWFSVETGCGPDGKGKFRIVMDASGKVDNVSLNDCLFSTPEITSSIFNSAFAFRHKKFVVTADIKKMFFQFIIPEEQRNYLRILVHEDLDPCKPIVHKRFKRDPFGVSQAGVIASLGVKLTARDNLSGASVETLNAINQDTYMDDFNATADTPELAAKIGLEVLDLGLTSKFQFCKFDSNSFKVLDAFPKDLLAENAGPVLFFRLRGQSG